MGVVFVRLWREPMAEIFFKKAKSDLTIQQRDSAKDTFLWEHSVRVSRLVDCILTFPETSHYVVDRQALSLASLYHDAGWAWQVKNESLDPREILLRPTTDMHRELAADWMESRLADHVPPATLQLAGSIIRQMGDRKSSLVEAQVLAEADNLDEIGPQAICTMLRKQTLEGKSTADMLAVWKRQEEYHYWQARIKEFFRLPTVRRLAQQRYEMMQVCMEHLRVSIELEDVENFLQPHNYQSDPRHQAS
jgi:hypothetical protein